MRKAFLLILTLCMLLSVTGCTLPIDTVSTSQPTTTDPAPAEAVFRIDDSRLQITADSTFREKTAGSYDLQLTNDRCYISIMAFKYIDLPTGVTPTDVFDMQNEDLWSKRDNVATVEKVTTQTLPHCTVTHTMYSAEKDGSKNYYASYLVDFPNAETFAWVLVSAMPSYLVENKAYLNTIVCSLLPTA